MTPSMLDRRSVDFGAVLFSFLSNTDERIMSAQHVFGGGRGGFRSKHVIFCLLYFTFVLGDIFVLHGLVNEFSLNQHICFLFNPIFLNTMNA